MREELVMRAIVWKNLALNGTEHCALCCTDGGWLLKGNIVGVSEEQRPILATYEVFCDDNWLTRHVQVERTIGKDKKTLSLNVEKDGVWRSSGQDLPEVRGCLDVDLAVTPATNTLPIRRLHLEIGRSEPVTAAWITFPELQIQLLRQRYTRVGKNIYRYEGETEFSAEIVVDDLGLVMTYPVGGNRSPLCRGYSRLGTASIPITFRLEWQRDEVHALCCPLRYHDEHCEC